MVTWVGFVLHGGANPRSWQCHLKVTARSNQPKLGKELILVVFSPIMSTWHIYNDSNPHRSKHRGTRRTSQKLRGGGGGNIGVGGVIPHQITLMSPRSDMAEMDRITGRLSWLDQWPVLPLKLIKPNPSTHGDMGWGCALWGCYPKVIARSSQVNSKVKSA